MSRLCGDLAGFDLGWSDHALAVVMRPDDARSWFLEALAASIRTSDGRRPSVAYVHPTPIGNRRRRVGSWTRRIQRRSGWDATEFWQIAGAFDLPRRLTYRLCDLDAMQVVALRIGFSERNFASQE